MTHWKRVAVVAILAGFLGSGLMAQTAKPADVLGWHNSSPLSFRTVKNGSWSAKPQDAPTKDEVTRILDFACDAQRSVGATEYFYVVVQDPQAQADIVGESWGKGATSAGTVTILVLADQIADQKDHKEPYGPGYSQIGVAYFDVGISVGQLVVAAESQGFATHIFSGPSGSLVGGQAVGRSALAARIFDLSKIVKGTTWMRVNGGNGKAYAVDGNCQFVACIVIGKPDSTIDAVAAVTSNARPKNYAFWAPTK